MKNVQTLFDMVWETLPEVKYSNKWENGSGYFDGAFNSGREGRCKDPNGRRVILINTLNDDGETTTAVWNERYVDRDLYVFDNAHRFIECALSIMHGNVAQRCCDESQKDADAAAVAAVQFLVAKTLDQKSIIALVNHYASCNSHLRRDPKWVDLAVLHFSKMSQAREAERTASKRKNKKACLNKSVRSNLPNRN